MGPNPTQVPRADPVSMSVTFLAQLGACSFERADPVNRSVNNIRLTLNMSAFERSDNGVQSTTAEATIAIDYMKHNPVRLIAL